MVHIRRVLIQKLKRKTLFRPSQIQEEHPIFPEKKIRVINYIRHMIRRNQAVLWESGIRLKSHWMMALSSGQTRIRYRIIISWKMEALKHRSLRVVLTISFLMRIINLEMAYGRLPEPEPVDMWIKISRLFIKGEVVDSLRTVGIRTQMNITGQMQHMIKISLLNWTVKQQALCIRMYSQ